MKTLRIIVVTVVWVLFIGVAAEADDLYSPPLFPAVNQFVFCHVANVSGRTGTIQWEIIRDDGVVVKTGGPVNVGTGQVVGSGIFIDCTTYECEVNYYCHFVVSGKAGQYRAAIKLSNLNNGGGDLVTLSTY